jgi:hypothetical protein
LKGHDFSRAENAAKRTRALQVAEKLIGLKGHDFSRAESAAKKRGLYRLRKNSLA